MTFYEFIVTFNFLENEFDGWKIFEKGMRPEMVLGHSHTFFGICEPKFPQKIDFFEKF